MPNSTFQKTSYVGLFVLMVGLAFWKVYSKTLAHPSELSWNSYAFSDFLINYSSGFVRRGLLGQILTHISEGESTLPLLNRLVFANYVLLMLLMILLVVLSDTRIIQRLFFTILFPAGLISMAYRSEFFFRKEMLFYSAFATSAIFFRIGLSAHNSKVKRACMAVALWSIFIYGALLALVHEGFFFLGAPANIILIYFITDAPRSRDLAPGAPRCPPFNTPMKFYLLLQIGLLVLSIIYKGDASAAAHIWTSLNRSDADLISPDGHIAAAIAAIGWSFQEGVRLPLSVITSGAAWYWLVPLAASLLYAITWVSTDINASNESSHARSASLVQMYLALLLCSLPMYGLGWDWGRWISAVNIAFITLYLIYPEGTNRESYPVTFEPLNAHVVKTVRMFYKHRNILIPVALIISLSLRIPECCISAAN